MPDLHFHAEQNVIKQKRTTTKSRKLDQTDQNFCLVKVPVMQIFFFKASLNLTRLLT